MGGAPCVVIVLCGGLKASMEGAAAWQEELCENAAVVTESLTQEEVTIFNDLNARGVKLMKAIDKYTADSKAAWKDIAEAHASE